MEEFGDIWADISADAQDDAGAALKLLLDYGGFDGAHHKMWVIDQAVRLLSGVHYPRLIAAHKAGEDGPDTYEWVEFIKRADRWIESYRTAG